MLHTASVYDVAILGGGFAGWAAAYGLAKAGARVAVVARDDPKQGFVGEHLPPEGLLALSRLGLPDLLEDAAHLTSPAVAMIWGPGGRAEKSYLMQPGGRAWNIDRQTLGAFIRARAESLSVESALVRTITISGEPGGWEIETTTGVLRARWIVDATGRVALGAQHCGAEIRRDDGLIGMAVRGQSVQANASLFIESMQMGWWYAAPLANGHTIAVALSDPDLIPKAREARQAWWTAKLAETQMIQGLLAEPEVGDLQIVPAWSQCASSSVGLGWIAIGDAAMAFDPLSSAGMTKALCDAADLAQDLTAMDTDPAAIETIEAARQKRYAAYRAELARNYRAETRYAAAPFWNRRVALAG